PWPLERVAKLRLVATMSALGLVGVALYLGGVRASRSLQLTWLTLFLLASVLGAGCAFRRTRRLALGALVLATGVELWLAGGDLPPRFPAPVEAYAQPRDSTLFVQSRLNGGRFLSIASEAYELKETPDYRERYRALPLPGLDGF